MQSRASVFGSSTLQSYKTTPLTIKHRASRLASHAMQSQDKTRKMLSDYQGYKKQFTDVEDITATEVYDLLHNKDSKLTLVDVRTPEERQVAVIDSSAISPEDFAARKDDLKQHTIVTYCTAGLRSGKLASKIQQEGFKVRNLEGSIIAWTQAGYPLVKGDGSGQSTKNVHAYGAQWAELIADGYEPVTFSNSKGLLEGVRSVIPRWLGGTS